MHLFINWHIYSLSKFSKQTCFQGLVCPCLSGCAFTTSNQRISHNSPVVQVMAGFDACLSSKSKNVQTINSQDMAFLKTPRCEQLHNADAFRVCFFSQTGPLRSWFWNKKCRQNTTLPPQNRGNVQVESKAASFCYQFFSAKGHTP